MQYTLPKLFIPVLKKERYKSYWTDQNSLKNEYNTETNLVKALVLRLNI